MLLFVEKDTKKIALDILLLVFKRMNNSFGLFPSHQITKQIDAVNEVYRLHNLPEFYKVRLMEDTFSFSMSRLAKGLTL